jgi:hypothetical protein
MADYYTEASFTVPLSNEQIQFSIKVLECVENDKIDFNKRSKDKLAKSFDADVYRVAKKLALSLCDYEPGMACLDFVVEVDGDSLLISHEETINTDNAAMFVHLILKFFDLNICVSIQASHACSRPMPDAFGGHAYFVTKGSLKMMTTHCWVDKQTTLFNKRMASNL